MHKLVLLRHGESTWNNENRFTGWTDVDLSDKGREEAHEARAAAEARAATPSTWPTPRVLKRAIRTLWIVLDEMDLMWIPVHRTLAAERAPLRGAAGAQQGRDGGEVRRGRRSRSGAAATTSRRRALSPTTSAIPANDPRYADLRRQELPLTECLKDTVARFLPYWHETIAPAIQAGQRVLIAAHGNSLRALVKYLDGVPARRRSSS